MKRLRDWYDGLADRERRLVTVFLTVLVVIVVLLIPYGTSALLSSRRQNIADLRDAINQVQNSRSKLEQAENRRKELAARYGSQAPDLAGFMEQAARQSGLEIPESQPRADVPHGKRFTERSTVVRMRKVGLLPLLRMFERLEKSGHPVVVSTLNLRRRGQEPDSYDVSLGVSAYDRKAAPATTGTSPEPASSGVSP